MWFAIFSLYRINGPAGAFEREITVSIQICVKQRLILTSFSVYFASLLTQLNIKKNAIIIYMVNFGAVFSDSMVIFPRCFTGVKVFGRTLGADKPITNFLLGPVPSS